MKPDDALMDEALAILPDAFDGAVEGVIALRFTPTGWRAPFLGQSDGKTGVYIADYDGEDISITPFVGVDPEVEKMLAKATQKADALPKPQPL